MERRILIATVVKLERKCEKCSVLVTLEFMVAPSGEPSQITIPRDLCPLPANGVWEVGSAVHFEGICIPRREWRITDG
jgi:hypothetical protein